MECPSRDSSDCVPSLGNAAVNRRGVLKTLAAAGVGTLVFQRALAAQVTENGAVTSEMIQQAEWIAGLELSEEDREATASAVQSALHRFEELRRVDVGYDVPPALYFTAAPGSGDVPGVQHQW